MLAEVGRVPQKDVRWFGPCACVEHGEDGRYRVFVGGRLIGEYGPQDRGIRNTLVLGLSRERSFRKGKLAEAFGITDEHLRRIRRRYEAQGEAGIPRRGPGGSKPKADAKTRERLFRRFEEGMDAGAAKKAEPQIGLSCATVRRMRRAWEASRSSGGAASEAVGTPVQTVLFEALMGEAGEPERREETERGTEACQPADILAFEVPPSPSCPFPSWRALGDPPARGAGQDLPGCGASAVGLRVERGRRPEDPLPNPQRRQ
jgi:hypothetical protein